ncbi:MAG: hypothetical protein HQK49_05060 [Oligoflexia bacterium]|nr:hypothetical protein [Oligoflexia bacterium]
MLLNHKIYTIHRLMVWKALTIFFVLITFSAHCTDNQEIEILYDFNSTFLNENIEYKWGSDPFLKNAGYYHNKNKKPPALILNAIIFDEINPLAIINGKLVRKNESFKGRRIREIGENYILLEQDNSIIELQLPPNESIEDNNLSTNNSNDRTNSNKQRILEIKEITK